MSIPSLDLIEREKEKKNCKVYIRKKELGNMECCMPNIKYFDDAAYKV
jgi:hypothetical protein